MPIHLTKEQEHIIGISKNMANNELMSINACAGSGKTSTLKEIAKENPDKSFLYLAFNKSIVDDSKDKFPPNVKVQTINSLAYQAIILKNNRRDIVAKYNFFECSNILPFANYADFKRFQWDFDIFLNSHMKLEEATNEVQIFFNAIKEGLLPYSHSAYLKEYQLLENKDLNKYDFILLDEAQDTNGVSLGIFLDNNARKILVGDTFQNIYGFRGAINALSGDFIEKNYECSLSNTFRCSQEIVDRANYFLEKYALGDNFMKITSAYEPKNETKTDVAVIARYNATIISIIDELVKKKELFNYSLDKSPSQIFEGAENVFHLFREERDRISHSGSWIKNFKSVYELEEYANETGDTEMQNNINIATRLGRKLFFLHKSADKIFRNENRNTIITNAHISKGLEFSNVILCDDFLDLGCLKEKLDSVTRDKVKEKRMLDDLKQERNLYYVAMTRAKDSLIDKTNNNTEYELKEEIDNCRLTTH